MWTTEEKDPPKWRFYHSTHSPDRTAIEDVEARTAAAFDPIPRPGLQVEDLTVGEQVNGDLGTMHSGLVDYDFMAGRASPRTPVKAVHDLSIMFPDNDSGFGSYKSKSRLFSSDDFSPPSPTRLSRSRSLSRLNGLTTQEMADVLEKPARSLQSALEESEARRTVLMHKLKEAQATLELQNDRLSKIENSAKDNNALVEDLKFKEREYRKKIAQLQAAEEEKQTLQMENIRLREEMQDRIDSLDFQLKSLKNQHQSTEDENNRRMCLLDQTSQALTLLEEENTRLQMDRDKLREEISVMKEAFQLSKSRYDSLESESKSHKSEAERLREENMSLNKRVHEMAGQMMELRNLLQAVKDDNERLSNSWRHASEDKHRASRQVEGYQETLADLKSRLAAATADKDRLFQERLDLNHKVQQLIIEKEQFLKAQMVLEEQVSEQQTELHRSKTSTHKYDDQRKHLKDELDAVKRVSEDLSTELASVKAFYERALEQLSLAESGKKLQEQQLELAEQERKRLQKEVDRLSGILDGRHRDDRQERQHLEDTILKMRSEMKDLKYDKDQLVNKNRELEAKLQKANEEIRGGMGKRFDELESWKTTCDRLTASVTRKETELQNLSDKCQKLEKELSRAEGELRELREKNDLAADTREELDRLHEENRRLLQEKAENEQMLQLLETQRDVLTKSTESGLTKMQDVEQLSGKVDQMRNENEVLRERILELEKVRDNLIKQKEDLLASSELIYKSQGLEELESKMEELREANKQLRDINEVMANKLQVLEQENLRLKHSLNDGSSKDELKRLREENKRLLGETTKLRQENSQYVSQTTRETDAAGKELQKIRKERDALQKQVQLINGQLNLLEGSKKRSDDTLQRTQVELSQLKSQLETSRKECAEAKRVAAQVKSLSEQLQKAKEKQESQEKLIRTMKEELHEERSKKPAQIQESLEDVGAELHHMRGELQKLMGEIENKEHTIEQLEAELRTAQDSADSKEHTVSDLKKLVADLERQNSTLKSSLEQKHTDSSGDERPSFVFKTGGEKSLKEELEEAVKSKTGGKHETESKRAEDGQISAVKQDSPTVPKQTRPAAKAASTPRLGTKSPTPPETPLNAAQVQTRFPFAAHSNPEAQAQSRAETQAQSSAPREKLELQIELNHQPSQQEHGQNEGSQKDTSCPIQGGDDTDFPPLTPPSPEDAVPKLSFAKPPSPTKIKHRRLPQVKTSQSHLAKAVMIRQAVTKQVEGIIASETKEDSATPSKDEDTASVSPLLKLFPSESEDQADGSGSGKPFSRKDFSAKPSRFLTDEGRKEEDSLPWRSPSQQTRTTVGTSQVGGTKGRNEDTKKDSTLLSFDELLGSESSEARDSSSTVPSWVQPLLPVDNAEPGDASKTVGSEQSSVVGTKASEKSQVRLSGHGQQTSLSSGYRSHSSGQQSNSSRSSSVKDFLAAFSPKDAETPKCSQSRKELTSSSDLHRSRTVTDMKTLTSATQSTAQSSGRSSSGILRSWTWHSLLSERDPLETQDTTSAQGTTEDVDTADEGPRSYAIFESDSGDPWSLLLDEPAGKTKSSTLPVPSSPSSTLRSSPTASAEEGQPLKFKPATGLFLSKSLGHPISAITSSEAQGAAGASSDTGKSVRMGRFGAMFFHKPEKPASESGDRLQSLISKYRSHSSDPLSGASSPVGGATARVSSAPPTFRGGLGSPKGRGFTPGSPKAPLLKPSEPPPSSSKPEETPAPKTGKKLPPPPPPKPGKSFMRSVSGGEGGARAEGEGSSDQMLDSQEQSDINALIQKPSAAAPPTKSLLSVHPPKITSKVIAGLLRSKKL